MLQSRRRLFTFLALVSPVGMLACTAGTPSTTNSGGAGATGGAATASTAEGTTASTVASSTTGFMTAGSGGGTPCIPGGPDDDVDGDGFTPNQGDCEDCDPSRNPNALEVPTKEGDTPFDEDCDGRIDEDDSVLCDDGLAIDSMDPLDALKAIELCKVSTGDKDWGIVDAKWVLADGTPASPTDTNFHLGHGILPKFGANVVVRKGSHLLALSSGSARQPGDPGYHSVNGFDKGETSGQPFGFPKESPACPGSITGTPHDSAGIEVNVRTPSNATGITFSFDFFTFEWPGFICSQFNDFFVALLTPFPMGQTDGNISYDNLGNPVSVNNAYINVCGCSEGPPCTAGGKIFQCALGDSDLVATGFGFDTNFGQDHGSTGWLATSAPVPGGDTINLRFAVYDSGDGVLDTTTLIDDFKWIATPGVTVGTIPVPQ